MPFDFGVEKVLIELDGEQHFSQVSNWSTTENIQKKDVEKIKHALEHGYSIIHLLQQDVWNDVYDWKRVLQEEIEHLTDQEPQCVFLQSCEKYGVHIAALDGITVVVKNPNMAQGSGSY